jgi:ABC-type multidrug transport system ATPase subunit
MAPDQAALSVRDLRRTYGWWRRVDAVSGVSFDVAAGEVFGLIGPDGAGKTSIMQVLAGVLRLHGGSAAVMGLDVRANGEAVRRIVGYMPQGLGSNLYETLTVNENIEFFRDLRQLPADVYARNRAALLPATRLEPFLDRRVAQLSGGMRQKLALICTLIHLPTVLLLDEPTTGVDPISRREFWQIIERLVATAGTTVLLSTSYMDEAERCDRIALLHAGRIVAVGTPDAVRHQARGHFVHIAAEPQTLAVTCLRSRPDVRSTEVFGDELHVQFDGQLRDIEDDLVAHGVTIASSSIQEPVLEDAFLQVLGMRETLASRWHFPRVASTGGGTSISCADVTCRFGSFTAVDRVQLDVGSGQILGLLGPNGAGKTTLIKMMCGLLAPSDGRITVAGFDVVTERQRVRRAIGYMSQRFSLYTDLSVRQNLRLYADLYGVSIEECGELAITLGLESVLARLARDLPSGVRQRLSLLCAVLHRPPIVFLDEPTSGVDPQARRVFWDLIYSLSRESGVTVVVSTHYMDEAAHCDRLGLMNAGRLVAIGSPASLRSRCDRGRHVPISMDDVFIEFIERAEPVHA